MSASPARRPAVASGRSRLRHVGLGLALVAAVGLAFGPVWAVRLGVALAVLAAAATALALRRPPAAARQELQERLLAESRAHGAALRSERQRNAAVVDVLSERVGAYREQADHLRVVAGELRSTISSLRGDLASLAAEVAHRDVVIESLRGTVQAREAELGARDGLVRDGASADVHELPRHVRGETSVWPSAAEGDRWSDASHPTVVDLPALEAILPNFEAERTAI